VSVKATEAAPPAARPAPQEINKWGATITVTLGMIATIMASTMINVAIADIMGAYGVGQDRVHWLMTGFLTATTVCMLLNAWFVRNLGPRNTFIIASVLFAISSIMGQLAPTFEAVLLARVVQGSCAGLIQPLGLNVIFMAFPLHERGKAMGMFGFGVMIGPSIGPAIGGVIVDVVDWHYVFTGALPFMAVGALMAARYLPGRSDDLPKARLNWVSFLLVAGSVSMFLNGISSGQREGWSSVTVLSLLLFSALAAIAMIELECRTKYPLLNVRLFTYRTFLVTSLVGFIFGAGMFGTFYLMPIFVRTIQGYTGTETGLLLLVVNLPSFPMYPIAGWISHRFKAVYPIVAGMSLFGLSAFALSFIDVNTGFWYMGLWGSLAMIGLALIMPALSSVALQELDRDLLPYGAGTLTFIRMMGGAMGVNCLAIVLDHRTARHGDLLAATQSAESGATADVLFPVMDLLAAQGLTYGEQWSMAYLYLGRMVAAQASSMAFQDAYMVLTVAFAVAIAITIVALRGAGAVGAKVS
jgi:DHA2 family multidrug resistance protein